MFTMKIKSNSHFSITEFPDRFSVTVCQNVSCESCLLGIQIPQKIVHPNAFVLATFSMFRAVMTLKTGLSSLPVHPYKLGTLAWHMLHQNNKRLSWKRNIPYLLFFFWQGIWPHMAQRPDIPYHCYKWFTFNLHTTGLYIYEVWYSIGLA